MTGSMPKPGFTEEFRLVAVRLALKNIDRWSTLLKVPRSVKNVGIGESCGYSALQRLRQGQQHERTKPRKNQEEHGARSHTEERKTDSDTHTLR